MRPIRIAAAALFALAVWQNLLGASPGDGKWRPLFDGKTLNGWTSLDISFWRVEDGAITGEATETRKPPKLLFLTCKEQASDFEMRFKFRILGPKANSGMQFRSLALENGEVHGYQADMANNGPYTGGIWDEFGTRNSLAARGEKVVIDEEGKKSVTKFADKDAILKDLDQSRWNEYRILARGPHIALKINGKVTAELTDREKGKAAASGSLAVALIPDVMKVQFKEIQIRRIQ